MPRMPNPPREGHPGKPPRRRGRKVSEGQGKPARAPRSYGQSAEMPEPAAEGRVDLKHESVEDLAGEPMREDGDDEKPR